MLPWGGGGRWQISRGYTSKRNRKAREGKKEIKMKKEKGRKVKGEKKKDDFTASHQ